MFYRGIFVIAVMLVAVCGFAKQSSAVLEKCEDHLASGRWNPKTIKLGLKALHKLDYQFSPTSMNSVKDKELSHVISQAVGFNATLKSLYRRAVEEYGSLQNALDENKIRYKIPSTYGVKSKWNEELVYAALQALYKNHFKPDVALFESKNPDAAAIVSSVVGFETPLSAVYAQAIKFNSGLYAALLKAGLPAKKILRPRKETYWTKDLIIKALQVLYAKGYLPNTTFLNKSKDQTAIKLVSDAVGFSTTLQRVWFYSSEFFGDLESALREADLPVERIVLRPDPALWSAEKVQAALQALGKSGFVITTPNLKHANDEKSIQIVSQAVGFQTRPRVVLEKSLEFFGHLQDALWTKEIVIRVLQALYREGYKPNQTFFKYTPAGNKKIETIISEAAGFPTVLGTVHAQSKRLFSNLKSALKDAELPVEEITRSWNDTSRLTPEKIKLGLQALALHGYEANSILLRSKNLEVEFILSQAVGFPVGLKTFYNKTLSAGPIDRPLQNFWDKELLYMILNILYNMGFTPYAPYLLRSENPLAEKILKFTLGYPFKLRAVYRECIRQFGSFEKAIEFSRLPSEKIIELRERNLSKQQITDALQALYNNGVIPKPTILASSNVEILRIISDTVGQLVDGKTLLKLAKKEFGNLRMALLAARLPVEDILRASRDISYMATMPVQTERIEENGEIRYETYFGEAPVTPEQSILKDDLLLTLKNSLPEHLQGPGGKVIDVILNSDLKDFSIEDIFAKLKEEKDGITLALLQDVMMHLSKNSELRDYLLDGLSPD